MSGIFSSTTRFLRVRSALPAADRQVFWQLSWPAPQRRTVPTVEASSVAGRLRAGLRVGAGFRFLRNRARCAGCLEEKDKVLFLQAKPALPPAARVTDQNPERRSRFNPKTESKGSTGGKGDSLKLSPHKIFLKKNHLFANGFTNAAGCFQSMGVSQPSCQGAGGGLEQTGRHLGLSPPIM
jgi:hypothetical protein